MKNPIIKNYDDGNVYSKTYKNEKGKYHNENGPALILYYRSGKIQEKYYFLYNKFHREDGPAVIYYNEYGEITIEQFYLYDKSFNSLKELQDYKKTLILS